MSDGITSPNQTNLVLKGIIGIQAMSEISTLVSQDTDAAQFKVFFPLEIYSYAKTVFRAEQANTIAFGNPWQ